MLSQATQGRVEAARMGSFWATWAVWEWEYRARHGGDSKLGGGLEERKEAAELLVGGISSSQLLAPAHHGLSLAYLWQPHCGNSDVRQEQVCCHSE